VAVRKEKVVFEIKGPIEGNVEARRSLPKEQRAQHRTT